MCAGGRAASAEEETSSGFDSSDITETPPFIPAQEWSESALGENELGDSGKLYYNEDGGGGAGEVGVDDDWVQGLYDMEGMSGDTA